MRVQFWGVRGSVPWAVPAAVRTGCNTPCLHLVDDASGASLILDAGTGVVGLGDRLVDASTRHTILLSHYHWDHVQGLPFFAPAYRPGQHIEVLGPAFPSVGRDWARLLYAPPHFPLPLEDLASPPHLSFVEADRFQAGGFHVHASALNHPGGSLAYRISAPSGDVVYATDHEFGRPEVDRALAAFAAGARAIVMDAHFTPDELPGMTGRGHGSWAQCLALAAEAGIPRVWLFHHKPGRSDDELEAIERAARRTCPGAEVAREGVAFSV